jgi:hypothetical protein
MSLALREVCGKREQKYFKLKYRPTGILINVNCMICLKFKVQLKFRKNNNYSSIIVSFHTVYVKKCIDLN